MKGMWNHAQNCTSGGEEAGEPEGGWRKDRIEQSLDLSQYLKYLDQLFGQRTSEADSSESDDDDRSRTFTEFRQPPVANQTQDRSHQAQALSLSAPGNAGDLTNHVNSFPSCKPLENFHIESNISSSSLSSIDSGTSSLSLNLSSEPYLDSLQSKLSICANGISKSFESKRGDDDASEENNDDKDKNTKKKKKAGKSTTETFPRQNRPNSGGKGNGSKGGGNGSGAGGSSSSGGSSSDTSGSSSGSSSSQNVAGSNSGSPGAKNCSGTQQTDNADISKTAANNSESNNNHDSNNSAKVDLHRALRMRDSNTDTLSLHDDYADSFGTDESFHLNSILDNIADDDDSFSDYISVSTNFHSTNSSPSSTSQSSTNYFSKVADIAASISKNITKDFNEKSTPTITSSNKSIGKKRKIESNNEEEPDKLSYLTEKQKKSRIELLNAKRKKIYIAICRKDVIKAQRTRSMALKEASVNRKKLAQMCARHVRKTALQSQNYMKESICKAQRLTREMEAFWKSEKKRQIRMANEETTKKLNENPTNDVYENEIGFTLNKLVALMEMFANKVLCEKVFSVSEKSVFPDSSERHTATNTLEAALKEYQSFVKLMNITGSELVLGGEFDAGCNEEYVASSASSSVRFDITGINFLKKMYLSGRNGILADESGVSSTNLPIMFLDYLSRSGSSKGPFLVISSSKLVAKWAHELSKLFHSSKLATYTGADTERQHILRWDSEAGQPVSNPCIFLTTHTFVLKDLKLLSLVKWQYVIIDDSQNMLSASSKWLPILSFPARSKILIRSCFPVTLSSQLWAYLYFIMPTLFDSQKELLELFLRELEGPSTLKEDTIPRLQNIVNSFTHFYKGSEALYAVVNVDQELDCFLTRRQRNIYQGLLRNTEFDKILSKLNHCTPDELANIWMSLLSLIEHLKLTCSHPDLIEGRVMATPFMMTDFYTEMASAIRILDCKEDKGMITKRLCSIFNVPGAKGCEKVSVNTFWGFTRLIQLSIAELESIFNGQNSVRLNYLVNFESVLQRILYDYTWRESRESKYLVTYPTALLQHSFRNSQKCTSLLFIRDRGCLDLQRKCSTLSTFSSIELRGLRSRSHWQLKMMSQESSLAYSNVFKFVIPRVVANLSPRSNAQSFGYGSELVNQIQFSDSFCLIGKILEKDAFVADSGKLIVFNDLLHYLRKMNHRVLVTSYNYVNLSLIENYLKGRRLKYTKIDKSQPVESDNVSIYLVQLDKHSDLNFHISCDSIVFFDGDSEKSAEDRKRLLKTIGGTHAADCYRLLCKGTIEDHISKIPDNMNEIHKLSMEGNFKIAQSHVTGLIELLRNGQDGGEHCSITDVLPLQDLQVLDSISTSNLQKQGSGPIPLAPTEGFELNVSDDGKERPGTEFGRKDTASLSLDEGYMGMSPDSFDEIKIKPDYEEHSFSSPKKQKLGRGSGKRGRPPSRATLMQRERIENGIQGTRRGPGRPRLKHDGPLNSGTRGRKPGRPPLSKKAEAISSAISSLSSAQNLYGFYSSSSLELS